MMLDGIIEDVLNKEIDHNKDKKNFSNVKYNKIDELVCIDCSKNWEISLGLVQWGDNDPKYEIRKWKKDGTAGKGITFTKEQLKQLVEQIKDKEFKL